MLLEDFFFLSVMFRRNWIRERIFKEYLFIYFWLLSPVEVCGLFTAAASLVEQRAQAQYLWHMGLVAPQHVGPPQTRDRTRVPCIGSQIISSWLFCSSGMK